VRVDNPQWGTRNDIVPWGLADWWNYGGITRSVWLERTSALHVVRADVVPHLDGFDVTSTVRRAPEVIGAPPRAQAPEIAPVGKRIGAIAPAAAVRFELFPAEVTPANLTEPDAEALVPAGARALAAADVVLEEPASGIRAVTAGFLLGGADLWSPERPALYVLRTSIADDAADDDLALWSTFGLRRVSVEPESGRLLLNGEPRMLNGVALHDEVLEPAPDEADVGGHRVQDPAELLAQLDQARSVDAELLRAGHTPANPIMLLLADRLGFAVWEEIPLYHYTPLTFGVAMRRGIPQQMLREMALRDMNRPSVLFHGLANESTGSEERLEAMAALHDVDRAIDGTRLTGQAAYGSQPADPTHAPLDVAGFTFYHGVFYGDDAASGTAEALDIAREANPGKPVLALEFGRWADVEADRPIQRAVFQATFPQFLRRSAERADGFVGGAVWWTLRDYATMRPGILLEHFGLFDRDGSPRPAAEAAARAFVGEGGQGAEQMLQSDVRRADVAQPPAAGFPRLLLMLGYGVLVSSALIGLALAVLLVLGGHSSAPRRTAPARAAAPPRGRRR
jgi:beta-glucuronidase